MAATVVSMARALVGSVVSKAASAASDEASLLLGVQKEIWYIKDELKTIQAFLRAAEVAKKNDELLQVWAEQVQDLSYDIEDCLDEFKVHVKSQSLSRQLLKLGARHRIAIRIRNLKARVEEVSNRNTRYSLIKPISSSSTDERDSYMEDVRNQSANNKDESELVGFATPKRELLKLIDVSTNDGPSKAICVVGMGGLGKTTLARKTYESKEDIARHFSCSAWVTVSQSFDRKEILKDMIRQLLGTDSLDKLLKELQGKLLIQVHHLADYLVQGLKEKRYFVVLDDLWSIDAWNWISDIAFPKNNSRGSRILVTTRDAGLAKRCAAESLIYHLEPLQLDDAIHLLLRKTNKREVMETGKNMDNVVAKLVKKCGCLPLAILTVGGILATKNIEEWGKFYEELPSELESNPSLEAMRRMITLSYNHLPSHLKPCFLYLSIFPEDFKVRRRRLVDRWIAEGFVKNRDGVNIEDVGNGYFNELINRSMIQPSMVNIEGVIKECRVHDIMHDIIVSVSREEKFVLLTKDNVTSVEEENIRHVGFHGDKCSEICLDWSIVRSVSVFGDRPVEPAPSFCSPQLRMLRVLDLEDAKIRITQKDANNIGLLRHLKYLNVAGNSYNSALIRSIGKLQCLQTLNMREANVPAVTTEITKLRSLRSLSCSKRLDYGYFNIVDNPKGCMSITMCLPMIFTPLVHFSDRANLMVEIRTACSTRSSDTKGVRMPIGINNLKRLQTLEVVDIKGTSKRALEELGELSQLRKLSMTSKGATENKYKILCAAIEKLSCLQSLYVDAEGSSDVGTLEWLASISSSPPLLRSLKLNGSLADVPNWFGNLKQLVKMHLSRTRLKEGKMMEILGALSNLMLLRLYRNAYIGEKLVFRREAFPNLKEVDIYFLKQLREIRFEEGTAHQLGSIDIYGCRLESGIVGIKHLPRIKVIELQDDGEVANFDLLRTEVDAHPNHPVLQVSKDRGHSDLGGIKGPM